MRELSQAEIGIVLTQQNAILSTGSKHPIRLIHAFIDQIINQDTNIGLVTTKYERILSGKLSMRIDTGYQALCRRLLISRRTIDLTSQEETVNYAGFKRIFQILRIEIIIFNGISRFEHDAILKTGNGMQCFQLNIQRKGRRKTLQVILIVIPAFRLQEQLMRILIGKGSELVFDARTIAGATTMDQSREEGRAVKAGAEDVMDGLVRMEDITLHLGRAGLNRRRDVQERKTSRGFISDLDRQLGQIDRADIDPRGSARLHPGGRNSKRGELIRDMVGRQLADPPAFESVLPNEHLAVQEGAGCQNNRPRLENCPGNRTDARQNAILKEKIFDKIRVNS